MKLVSYNYKNDENVGILFHDDNMIYDLKNVNEKYKTMNDLIYLADNEKLDYIKSITYESVKEKCIFVDNVTLLAPIPYPNQDIICLGINYTEHAKESARFKKETFEKDRKYTVYFSKRVNKASAHNDYIPSYEGLVDSLDYECELAVILNKDATKVTKEESYNYILGYTIINDVSARNLQTRHKQWYLGKSLDGFTPMGPCLVTKDEFSFPPKLKIQSKVNGEIRQNSNTELMITSIAEAISELSQAMTLKRGTIIAMGTPAGVGMGFVPPRFLKPGDEVQCEIEGIGKIINIIK